MARDDAKPEREMKKIFWLLMVACGATQASDWQYIAKGDSSFFYMDFDSVSNVGAMKKAWIKGTFYTEQETVDYPKKKYQASKTLFYFDCAAKTISSTQFIAYSTATEGDVVFSSSYKFDPRAMQDVIPDSIGETYLKVACSPAASRAKIKAKNEAASAAFDREYKEFQRRAKLEEQSEDSNMSAAQRRQRE